MNIHQIQTSKKLHFIFTNLVSELKKQDIERNYSYV